MTNESSEGRIEFEVDGTTLGVRDVIEGTRLDLRVDRQPNLSPALPELFPLPVDRAVSFEAESISIAEYSAVNVRSANGDFVAHLDEPAEFPHGDYCVEINGVTKVLLRIEDAEIAATGMAGPEPVELAFDRARTVTVGGRSLHTRPEATITVPDDPVALTEAVSVLGSSIQEFSPERSWPTLRGYPPRIERGDALDIPNPLTPPATGVEVVVRPTYADVYRLSTLSYYLGARMVTGEAPAIRLDTGYEERLPTEGDALERRVEDLFRTWFFLDTLARTEGYVPSDRYEYEQVGSELPFYPPNLADLSMSERLMEYLEVDPETVAPYAPAWSTEAVLRPSPEGAELLPHLARLLAPVRVRGTDGSERPDAPVGLARSGWSDGDTERPSDPATEPIPAGNSVLTSTAYENRLRREVTDRGDVTVAFLLETAERARSVRDSLTTPGVPDGIGSWSVHVAPDGDTVAGVLSDPALDIVFCDLPAGDGVVEAADGTVDVTDLNTGSDPLAPAVSVFEAGSDLTAVTAAVDRGGLGGVVFETAIESRRLPTLIGLLAAGYPIVVAARLALPTGSPVARFVGDPGTVVATDRGLSAQLYAGYPLEVGSYRVRCRSFLTMEVLPGRDFRVIIDPFDPRPFLVGAERDIGQTDVSGILRLHEQGGPVVRLSDEFFLQNDELTAEDIEASARQALAADAAESIKTDAKSQQHD
ncbi:MAG: hypothetical protein ACOC06_04060 [Halorubrum sp.]